MNVLDTVYAVKAVLKDGSTMDVTAALTRLQWQDAAEEVAQRAIIGLAQVKTAKGYLNALLPLCTAIIILANGTEVFRGIVWEWEYESSRSQDITLTCYDHFIYAQNSKVYSYFPAGKSTRDIVSALCANAGIKLSYSYDNIRHKKTVYRSSTIADQLLTTLGEAKRQLKSTPVATFEKGTLMIRKEGYNSDVYVFRSSDSAMGTVERMTMDGLVTKVVVYGTEDKAGKRKIEATLNGQTQYGTLQEIILHSSGATLAEAKAEGEKILQDKGKPQRAISADVPDVPWIRKGWKVRVEAGSLLSYFIVKGVTHDAVERRMQMELKYIA